MSLDQVWAYGTRKRRWCRAANLSQVDIPHPGFDRQAVKFHLRQRRCCKSRDDIAASNRALQPIELVGADDNNGIFPIPRDPLRTALLRVPDHLAKSGLRVLKSPSAGPGVVR